MLRKLISAALRQPVPGDDRRGPIDDRSIDAPSAAPGLDVGFAPMVPLRPPEARNDNPLTGLCAAVEADLRAAGYLR